MTNQAFDEHALARRAGWDDDGWVLVGTREVIGRSAREVIDGQIHERFERLAVVVTGDELELRRLDFQFADGCQFSPHTHHRFTDGARSLRIHLPGGAHEVRRLAMRCRSRARRDHSVVQLWGSHGSDADEIRVLLDDHRLAGGDLHEIRVHHKDLFGTLTLVVLDAELEVESMLVRAEHHPSMLIPIAHSFRDGARSLTIPLPHQGCTLRRIELRCRASEATPRVQLWAE